LNPEIFHSTHHLVLVSHAMGLVLIMK